MSKKNVLIALFFCLFFGCSPLKKVNKESDLGELMLLETLARKKLLNTLQEGLPYRRDGYAYAYDLGNILRAAAVANDEELFKVAYERLRQYFLIGSSGTSKEKKMVVYRTIDGTNKDTTGWGETINVADALWIAFERWGKEEHKMLAYDLAQSYIRHGSWIDGNRFYVKKYYNHETNTSSESAWLLHQRPDVLLRIGKGTSDTTMLHHANGMARFCRGALLANGFSRELFDADIANVIPGRKGYFSPDGYFALLTTLSVNYSLILFDRQPARVLLNWLSDRLPNLRSTYIYNLKTREFEGRGSLPVGLAIRSRILQIMIALQQYDSSNPERLDDFVESHFLSHLRDSLANPTISTYYFEVPLVIEAIHELRQAKRKYREMQSYFEWALMGNMKDAEIGKAHHAGKSTEPFLAKAVSSIAGFPGYTWGVSTHDLRGSFGTGVSTFVNQGIDWITISQDITLNTYAEYRFKSRTKDRRYFDGNGMAFGLEFKTPIFRTGAQYSRLKYPELNRIEITKLAYLQWYHDWYKYMRRRTNDSWFQISAFSGNTWGRITRDVANLTGTSISGFVNQGIDWFTLPGDITLNTYGEYRFGFRTKDNFWFNSHGPAFGIEMQRPPFKFGMDYFWERYPERRVTEKRWRIYLGWYYDWDFKANE